MKTALQTLLLFAALCAAAFFLTKGLYIYLFLSLAVALWALTDMYRRTIRIRNEVALFAQTIHSHDFSGKFDEQHVPREIREVRRHFNTICDTMKCLNRDREVHDQYMHKVLEIIDTGILSYNLHSGEVLWMNDAVKKMLQIPSFKVIRSLEKRIPSFFHEVKQIKTGTPQILHLHREGTALKLLVSTSLFQIDNQSYRLIAMQNVGDTLTQNEEKAWQKLLGVLTHEIMNSVAPISSLAETLRHNLVGQINPDAIDSEALEDLRTGIETIGRRSEGLLRFAKTYRSLNKIGKPKWEKVEVAALFAHISCLLSPTMAQKEIHWHIHLPDPALTLQVDRNLMEQVLVNLVTNAIEAVKGKEEKRIVLSAYQEPDHKVVVRVSDNGCGIPPEMMENIFMPFFSTRSGGSGIGLTLCRQIMALHKGAIQVKSEAGKGATFILQFG